MRERTPRLVSRDALLGESDCSGHDGRISRIFRFSEFLANLVLDTAKVHTHAGVLALESFWHDFRRANGSTDATMKGAAPLRRLPAVSADGYVVITEPVSTYEKDRLTTHFKL